MGMNDMVRFVRQMSGKLGSNIYAGLQPQTNAQQISFIRQLQKEMKQKNSLDCPLNELPVIVFDLETTGFFPEKGDKVISIGAIKMTGSKIHEKDVFYSLVKTDTSIPIEISKLTNIDNGQLEGAPEAKDVLIDFFNFIGSSILVAHHAKHEQAFMKKISLEQLRVSFEHRIIDTSFLVRLTNPVIHPLPLEQLCNDCGIEVTDRHHALADAKMAAQIWAFFLKKAQHQGYNNLREVYEYLSRQR
ncbi:exonuclease domain-containing protein [Heyndrickxia sp. MSNUG]|uniref:exonuclease domain-containing protein n=1 Tax=Heyndrickxia sp. MSNUG TaxID=3136677 RepID=UPI003C2C9285